MPKPDEKMKQFDHKLSKFKGLHWENGSPYRWKSMDKNE